VSGSNGNGSHRWDTARQVLVQILRGERDVPLRCMHCGGRSIVVEEESKRIRYLDYPSIEHATSLMNAVICLHCGRSTPIREAHYRRRQEIKALASQSPNLTTNPDRRPSGQLQ
jgi:DNA-directed RNA polymerase subunit RPC12/RpoP